MKYTRDSRRGRREANSNSFGIAVEEVYRLLFRFIFSYDDDRAVKWKMISIIKKEYFFTKLENNIQNINKTHQTDLFSLIN